MLNLAVCMLYILARVHTDLLDTDCPLVGPTFNQN